MPPADGFAPWQRPVSGRAGGPSGNARATRNPYVGSRHNIDCNECDRWNRHARACPQRRDDYCRGGL